jgi:hypothetical protein
VPAIERSGNPPTLPDVREFVVLLVRDGWRILRARDSAEYPQVISATKNRRIMKVQKRGTARKKHAALLSSMGVDGVPKSDGANRIDFFIETYGDFRWRTLIRQLKWLWRIVSNHAIARQRQPLSPVPVRSLRMRIKPSLDDKDRNQTPSYVSVVASPARHVDDTICRPQSWGKQR